MVLIVDWKRVAGLGFYDIVGAWDNYANGYKGYNINQLNLFSSQAEAVFYVCMTVMQIGNLFSIRNRRASMWESNPFYGPRQNLSIFICIVGSLLVTVLNVYISSAPGNPNVFQIGYVTYEYWLIPIPLALGAVLLDEIRKAIARAYPNSYVAKAAW